jgi:hypothetical protein
MLRDEAVALELRERLIGRSRRRGIAKLPERQVGYKLRRPETEPRQRTIWVLSGRTNLELWTCVQYRVLPYDPIRARASLAVWKPAGAVA